MQSSHYIQKLKNTFGENLENLSPGDRYGIICLLSAVIARQSYPFQAYSNYIDCFEKILSMNHEAYSILSYCPVLAIPGVIKFLSESIPDQW